MLGVFAAAARNVRFEPLVTLLLVGLVPSLWARSLFDLLWSHVGGAAPQFSFDVSHVALTALRRVAVSGWTSFLVGGQYALAIDIARGNASRVRSLLRGFKLAVPVFLTNSALALALTPSALVAQFRHTAPVGAAVLAVVSVPIVLVVVLRTLMCIPLVVDRGQSFPAALRGSWALTDGESWKIARL